jgi:TolB-like protein
LRGSAGESSREPSAAAVHAQLARILASAAFVASDRLKGFLRFVVEETLAGRSDQLKAYTIALEVLGRDDGFDPQTDPVVRMEAGKLRRRLERYYLSVGQDDPVRIEIPKGGYVPTFSRQAGTPVATAVPLGLHFHQGARPHGRREVLLGLAGLGLAALALVTVLLWRAETPTVEAETAPPAPQARGPAIIVLPFEDLSEGPGNDADGVFAAGLTEELIANLMRFGELRLYSAFGSFQEQSSADPVELSERLDVGYVIQGSVRRDQDQLRLIVHLIEAQTGKHLWTETYDRALTPENLFAMQEQLAADLASQLAQPYGIINEVTAESFRQERPETLFAYDCVLRALDYRRTQGRQKHAAARDCLEQAVRRDPGYADAWAFLAYTYLDEYRFGGYGPRPYDPAALARAMTTARHALELSPDNVYGLLALSTMHFYRREFAAADEINRRLLTLHPTNPEVLFQVGWRTAFARDWDDGMALVRQAIDRSIKAPWGYQLFIVFDHYRRGDYEAALAAAKPIAETRMVQLAALLAAIHGQLGNKEEAQRELDRAMAINPLFLQDPRTAMRRHNTPEDLIDQVIDGLIKAGLNTSAAIN